MSNKPQFKQYRGPVTAVQAAEGIEAAIRTARGLLADARLLIRESRWPRALVLSILAIEETGKIPIIRGILMARTEEELRAEWNEYRKHTAKNVIHLIPAMVISGARQLEDFRPMFNRPHEPLVIDKLKQVAFYSNCGTISKWSVPEDIIDEDLATYMFKLAEVCCKPESFTSKEELEIFAKHLGPVWKAPMQVMKNALHAAYEEARAKGVLKSSLDADGIAKFLSIEPQTSIQ